MSKTIIAYAFYEGELVMILHEYCCINTHVTQALVVKGNDVLWVEVDLLSRITYLVA